jgi:hypothetical protein
MDDSVCPENLAKEDRPVDLALKKLVGLLLNNLNPLVYGDSFDRMHGITPFLVFPNPTPAVGLRKFGTAVKASTDIIVLLALRTNRRCRPISWAAVPRIEQEGRCSILVQALVFPSSKVSISTRSNSSRFAQLFDLPSE